MTHIMKTISMIGKPAYQWYKDVPERLKSKTRWRRFGMKVSDTAEPRAFMNGPRTYGIVDLYAFEDVQPL
jgi:hypothetical protein